MSRRCENVMARYREQQSCGTRPVEVHALRLGDVALATNPFELFLDYGLRIKARSKAPQTLIVQLTGTSGRTDASYLPTARAVAGASYGAMIADNTFGPEAGQVLVDQTVAMINEMWAEEGS
jgi:hypothetical protein